jgi:hypothetical protein
MRLGMAAFKSGGNFHPDILAWAKRASFALRRASKDQKLLHSGKTRLEF